MLGGCGNPSEEVPQDPPARPASQTSDLPPPDFLDADLVIVPFVSGDLYGTPTSPGTSSLR
jgi:hypothetical protein